MTNVVIISGLLVFPWLVAYVFDLDLTFCGRIGVSAVFLFTAIGHFFKTESMLLMLPPFFPACRATIYLSGAVEILFAVALPAVSHPSYVGWSVVLYLILIFPSNIYAAIQRIPFGGHSMGPRYLLVRFPLQVLLVLWTYYFSVKLN